MRCLLRVGPLLLLLFGPAAAAEGDPDPSGRLSFSTGFDFRRGDYGLERDTETWYVPFTLKWLEHDFGATPWRNDQLELGVTIPQVHISGPSGTNQELGAVDDRGEPLPVAGDPSRRRTSRHSGPGDLVARVTYLWFPARTLPLPAFEWTTRVKFPTGDEDLGLGTGAFQTSTQLDVYRSFGRLTPVATLGYRFFGASRDFHLRDGPLASLGFVLRGPRWLGGGAFLDWRRSATRGVDDLLELMPYLSIKPHRRLSLQPYAVVGFTDGSADYGLGLQLTTQIEIPRRRPGSAP